MGGIDVADQRIAYYQPDVSCQRVWIPMFIQGMGIVRNNSFIAYKAYHERMEQRVDVTLKLTRIILST